jgi:SAM-dependent methyltransferase
MASSRLESLGRRLPPVVGQAGARALRAQAALKGGIYYVRDLQRYRALPGAESLRVRDAFPQLTDRVLSSPFDRHYFYQDVWAAKRIAELAPARHVDVGSRVDYVGFLTTICEVTFIDIRPLEAEVDGLDAVAGSVLELPLPDRSVRSLSCLHVAEHVGLGRYGDTLDPLGTRRAALELQRVLEPDGQLLFSLPVGRPRVCFNAHRIHDPRHVLDMFDELTLVEFSGIDDAGVFRRHRTLEELAGSRYACGLYRFARGAVEAPPSDEARSSGER